MVSFAAEPIFKIGSFSITNTLLDTFIIDAIIVAICVFASKKFHYIPGKIQNLLEIAIKTFNDLIISVAPKAAKHIFPFVMTFFLFILLTNWSGLIPGVGTIGIHEELEGKKVLVPLIRAATSDINVTLALAVISAIATHFFSIKVTGIKDYVSRFFSLNPINLFVGILELISEVTKVISLSFRLFGNIFAGEVVLTTVSSMFAFLFPLPFMLLEVIVGAVQAMVFAMLTMAFMAIMTTPHHAPEHAHAHAEKHNRKRQTRGGDK
jgi:F-type H+-transporting ATPase subunit a